MRTTPWRVLVFVAVLAACVSVFAPIAAAADGKRDLEDGIAFYENLDSERARDRLAAASTASDLGPSDRAKAFLYLGLVHFEAGARPKAEDAWRRAFLLDRKVQAPSGTSPKTLEALERVRATVKTAPATKPTDAPPDTRGPTRADTKAEATKPKPEETKPRPEGTKPAEAKPSPEGDLPHVAPESDTVTPDLVAKTPLAAEPQREGGAPTWLVVAGIGAALVGAAAVAFLVLDHTSSDCKEGGGCLGVTIR